MAAAQQRVELEIKEGKSQWALLGRKWHLEEIQSKQTVDLESAQQTGSCEVFCTFQHVLMMLKQGVILGRFCQNFLLWESKTSPFSCLQVPAAIFLHCLSRQLPWGSVPWRQPLMQTCWEFCAVGTSPPQHQRDSIAFPALGVCRRKGAKVLDTPQCLMST